MSIQNKLNVFTTLLIFLKLKKERKSICSCPPCSSHSPPVSLSDSISGTVELYHSAFSSDSPCIPAREIPPLSGFAFMSIASSCWPWCLRFVWRRSVLRSAKRMWHIKHWKGFSPVCTLWCLISSPDSRKRLGQSWHTKFLWPVWMCLCRSRWLDLLNALPQRWHTWGLFWECVMEWRSRSER